MLIPAARVRNLMSRHRRDPGRGFGTGELGDVCGAPGPSGVSPISCGVRENTVAERVHMAIVMTIAIVAAALANPSMLIVATHNGEKITPPMLPPLYAVMSAAGRLHTNHGDTMLLRATGPIAAQPTPLSNAAKNNCHGALATAQPKVPSAREIAPDLVTIDSPKR